MHKTTVNNGISYLTYQKMFETTIYIDDIIPLYPISPTKPLFNKIYLHKAAEWQSPQVGWGTSRGTAKKPTMGESKTTSFPEFFFRGYNKKPYMFRA